MPRGPPVDAKPVNLDNYGTLPPGTKVTEIRNRKEGLQEFLKRDDKAKSIDLDRLRKTYLGEEKAGTKMPTLDKDDLERFITKQRRQQQAPTLRYRFK